MSDYTKSTNFAAKDALASGNAAKVVKGTEIDTEFNNIATAIATKADTTAVDLKADIASPAFTGNPTAPTPTSGDNDTSIATTAFVTTAVAALGYPAFKNRLINSDMRIDQRNAGASVTITTLNGQYTLDRWNVNTNQASKVSVQQSTTAPAGFKNSALITSLSAFSQASGDYFGFVQYVEGFNAADFDWGTANAQTVTLSFKVRASITGTYSVAIGNSAGARSYVATFTVDSANTYETKTITIAGDTSGTWLTDSGRGLRMWFDLGSGSSFNQASPNSWTASNTLRTSGSVSLIGTSGATFYITGVQLEKGSTATSFDYRPYGTELALCQRYYETGGGVTATAIGTGGIYPQFFFKATKRAASTITNSRSVVAGGDAINYWYQNSNDGAANLMTWTSSAEL